MTIPSIVSIGLSVTVYQISACVRMVTKPSNQAIHMPKADPSLSHFHDTTKPVQIRCCLANLPRELGRRTSRRGRLAWSLVEKLHSDPTGRDCGRIDIGSL